MKILAKGNLAAVTVGLFLSVAALVTSADASIGLSDTTTAIDISQQRDASIELSGTSLSGTSTSIHHHRQRDASIGLSNTSLSGTTTTTRHHRQRDASIGLSNTTSTSTSTISNTTSTTSTTSTTASTHLRLQKRDQQKLSLGPELPTAPPPAIVGNITFAGSVNLDTTTVNTATEVIMNGWHGTAAGGLPAVQSRDGTFATSGVAVGDATTFASPWPFNSGAIPTFWSVDGFTFDLLASHIVQQTGNGFLSVAGTGNVSKSGFTTTAGTFTFTSQDPSADSRFSFSAATSVPESSTVALFSIGAIGITGVRIFGRKMRDSLRKRILI